MGAVVGLVLTGWLTRQVVASSSPWLVAPMGASTVLLFAAPGSPLAQPWNALVGNVVSGLVGVTVALVVPDPLWAGALAVGGAIGAMHATRSLHPPGGAVALTAVLGGPPIHALGYVFVAVPVLLNTALLVAIAWAFRTAVLRVAGRPGGPPG